MAEEDGVWLAKTFLALEERCPLATQSGPLPTVRDSFNVRRRSELWGVDVIAGAICAGLPPKARSTIGIMRSISGVAIAFEQMLGITLSAIEIVGNRQKHVLDVVAEPGPIHIPGVVEGSFAAFDYRRRWSLGKRRGANGGVLRKRWG